MPRLSVSSYQYLCTCWVAPLEPPCPRFALNSYKPRSSCQVRAQQNRPFSTSPQPSRRLQFAPFFTHNWDNLSRWQHKWNCSFLKKVLECAGLPREYEEKKSWNLSVHWKKFQPQECHFWWVTWFQNNVCTTDHAYIFLKNQKRKFVFFTLSLLCKASF